MKIKITESLETMPTLTLVVLPKKEDKPKIKKIFMKLNESILDVNTIKNELTIKIKVAKSDR